MPIITTKPIIDIKGEYNKLGVQLAVSPMWRENDIGASVAIKMVPYRILEDGTIEQHDSERCIVYGDAFNDAKSDPILAQAITQIMDGLQKFITDKGL